MFNDNEPVVPVLSDYYNKYENPPKILENNDKTLNCEKHSADINKGLKITPSNSK